VIQVAASAELEALTGAALDGEAAIAQGLARRVKLRARWLYLAEGTSLDSALSGAEAAVEERLERWLLGHSPHLVDAATRRVSGLAIGRGAMELLVRELAAAGRLGTLAVLNLHYQPYLAFHRLADGDEIAMQLDALQELLASRGRARRDELPEPLRARSSSAWRHLILRHGEWQGLGLLRDRELMTW
jgi:hypothetical protein